MSSERISDYKHVKSVILRAYELVPDANIQKFSKYKKLIKHLLNSHDRKKICLISGLGLRNLIKLFFSYLRQVILLEEFNDCVSQDLKTDLEDNNSKTLEEAAVISDTLTHSHEKNFFTRPQNSNYS